MNRQDIAYGPAFCLDEMSLARRCIKVSRRCDIKAHLGWFHLNLSYISEWRALQVEHGRGFLALDFHATLIQAMAGIENARGA